MGMPRGFMRDMASEKPAFTRITTKRLHPEMRGYWRRLYQNNSCAVNQLYYMSKRTAFPHATELESGKMRMFIIYSTYTRVNIVPVHH